MKPIDLGIGGSLLGLPMSAAGTTDPLKEAGIQKVDKPLSTDPLPDEFDSAIHDKGLDQLADFTAGPAKTYHGMTGKCLDTHPVLQLGGGTIIGGSCNYPKDGADVYIGFDYGMKPWSFVPGVKPPVQIHYLIQDMQAPANHKDFEELISLTVGYLAQGKTIHCGCIGGHGRTGTFLSALVKTITGDSDSTTWVRKNYCQKAVESTTQVDFLHKYFGIKKVEGHKSSYGYENYSSKGKKSKGSAWNSGVGTQGSIWPKSGSQEIKKSSKFAGSLKDFTPVPSKKSVVMAKLF